MNSIAKSGSSSKKQQPRPSRDLPKPAAISRFEKLEYLRMEGHDLLSSLQQLASLVKESDPGKVESSPGSDAGDAENDCADLIVRLPTDAWDQIKKLVEGPPGGLERLLQEWDDVATIDSESERRIKELEAKCEELKRRNDSEEKENLVIKQRVELTVKESLGKLQKAFDSGKQLLTSDLDAMEKAVKKMKHSRRHFQAKQIMNLQQEELNFEDMMSSSEDPLKTGRSGKSQDVTPSGPAAADADRTLEDDENADCNMPRLALGGVLLKDNGEPVELSRSEEWVSEYGGTSSQSSEFMEYAKNHEAYKQAQNTVEKNLIAEERHANEDEDTEKKHKEERRKKKADATKPRKGSKRPTVDVPELQTHDTSAHEEGEEKANEVHFIGSNRHKRKNGFFFGKEQEEGGEDVEEEKPAPAEEEKNEARNGELEEVKLEQIMAVPETEAKYEEPLSPLGTEHKPQMKEELQDITVEDMASSRLDPSLNITLESMIPETPNGNTNNPFEPSKDRPSVPEPEPARPSDDSKAIINVVDYNGSGKETLPNNRMLMDNEELISEKEDTNKLAPPKESQANPTPSKVSLEIIQENNSEFSNSNSLVSGRSARRRRHCNSSADPAGKEQQPAKRQRNRSVFTAREAPPTNESEKDGKPMIKSSREKCRRGGIEDLSLGESGLINKSRADPQPRPTSDFADASQAVTIKKPAAMETPIQQKAEVSANISTTANMITKSIPTMTRGLEEGSTNYTTQNAKQVRKLRSGHFLPRSKMEPLSTRLTPAFLAQLAEECKGTDNMTLSSAGVLFGAGPLGEYTKGSMAQSFFASKPTLPTSELGAYNTNTSMNIKNKTPSSSITIRKLVMRGEECGSEGLLKISKRRIVALGGNANNTSSGNVSGILQPKLNLSFQSEVRPRICIKRLKIKREKA